MINEELKEDIEYIEGSITEFEGLLKDNRETFNQCKLDLEELDELKNSFTSPRIRKQIVSMLNDVSIWKGRMGKEIKERRYDLKRCKRILKRLKGL